MSRPSFTPNKKQIKEVERIFVGSKKVKGIKTPATIATMVGIPRRSVMKILEDKGLNSYSPNSYL